MDIGGAVQDALTQFVMIHWGSMTVLEAMWTTSCSIGVSTVGYLFREGLRDRDVLLRQADYIAGGPRAIVSGINIRSDAWRLIVEVGFLALGIQGCLTPSPSVIPSAYAIDLSVIATVICLSLAYLSVLDFRARRLFLREIRRAVEASRRDRRRAGDRIGLHEILGAPVDADLPYAPGDEFRYSRDPALKGEDDATE